MTTTRWILLSLVLALSTFVLLWAFVIEPASLTLTKLEVKKWPGPPMKIIFLSDLHAGSPHIDEEYVKKLVRRINEQSPDLVLIGGDLLINGVIGGKAIPIEKVAQWLSQIRANLGTYAVLGNHDWWNEGEKVREVLEDSGISVLENQAKFLRFGNFPFWLVGVGDDTTQHANVTKSFGQVTTDDPRLVFMHDPGAMVDAKETFFFALAGHMHGGQMQVPCKGALVKPGRAPSEWAKGWVNLEAGPLFVSKGIGTSILPFRLNAAPEFVMVRLRP